MNRFARLTLVIISLGMALCILSPAYGQSLADLARQERAKKKPAKVWSNEDIPPASISAPAPAEAAAAAPEGAPKEGEAAAAEAAKPAEEEKKSEAELEKEYRDKFAKLRETQEYEERRLDVMQRELNLMQQQHYSDPNVALREQYSREEINKRTEDMDKQKAVVDKAKQAVADLEEELQRKSLPAGWAR